MAKLRPRENLLEIPLAQKWQSLDLNSVLSDLPSYSTRFGGLWGEWILAFLQSLPRGSQSHFFACFHHGHYYAALTNACHYVCLSCWPCIPKSRAWVHRGPFMKALSSSAQVYSPDLQEDEKPSSGCWTPEIEALSSQNPLAAEESHFLLPTHSGPLGLWEIPGHLLCSKWMIASQIFLKS